MEKRTKLERQRGKNNNPTWCTSVTKDSGRRSLKLLFGGGEKAGKKLFLSEEIGIINMAAERRHLVQSRKIFQGCACQKAPS